MNRENLLTQVKVSVQICIEGGGGWKEREKEIDEMKRMRAKKESREKKTKERKKEVKII